jgi:hypothetical protein
MENPVAPMHGGMLNVIGEVGRARRRWSEALAGRGRCYAQRQSIAR